MARSRWALAGPRVRMTLGGNFENASSSMGHTVVPSRLTWYSVTLSGVSPGHQDEGEMVALHLEGPRRAAENLDGAGVFGLHPDQGGGVGNVPQCRAEEQCH